MQQFKDSKDRAWTIEISVHAVKRVRAALQIDLYALVDDGPKGLGELLGDPVQLVDVLYVLCQGEATVKNVSDEDFGRGLGGDALEAAADAFVRELIDFFPNRAARDGLRTLMDKAKALSANLGDRAKRQALELDIEKMAEELTSSWTSARASSESTPDLIPFAPSSP